jgi:hypothetical protein
MVLILEQDTVPVIPLLMQDEYNLWLTAKNILIPCKSKLSPSRSKSSFHATTPARIRRSKVASIRSCAMGNQLSNESGIKGPTGTFGRRGALGLNKSELDKRCTPSG